MRKILFSILCGIGFAQIALAQPATFGLPISIGRNNCGLSGGTDSVYFFNYVSPNLSRASFPNGYRPRLKIGPTSTTNRFTINVSSVAYNPKDQKLYYLWTNYSLSPVRTYVWRWRPDTTFATGTPPTTAYLDTLHSFPYDIGGVAFDNNGIGWTLEFPAAPCSRAFLRPIDFAAGIYNAADTLDFTTGPGGIGDTLWNPGNGDITMMPSGQLYYNFDNKLYTPDYGSYGGPTRHIKSTYIDSTKLPTGAPALVGLAFSDGDIISSYTGGCIYRRLNPVTGDTNNVSYTYTAGKGVRSVDMTQLVSGVGASKKLVSITPTGTPGQYDVVYDVYVKNYGTYPVTNLQVTDNLSLINGLANVSNVTAVFTSNPAGLILNAGYNGTSNLNLLNAGQTLPNYPISNNNFTIRISCRLSNIVAGIVYNNRAITSGNGFNNVALRDSSTNGNNPDLNQNDKPDDVGESQPTPFVVVITPITPPCTVLSQTLYNQDFGNGAGLNGSIPPSVAVPSASSGYTGTAVAPVAINRFTVTNNASLGNGTNWVSITDHTGGVNGRMLAINADASSTVMYRDTMPVSCPGQQYSVSFWAAFLGNTNYQTVCDGLGGFKYPQILVRIRDLVTGLVITQYTSDTIKLNTWLQHGMKWVMPPGYSSVILELLNAGPGGCGNDVALDDIVYGLCTPDPFVNLNNPGGTCLGTSVTFTANFSDPGVIPGPKDYQWQWSPAPGAGPWTNIVGATASTYIINPVTAADTGRYYRVIVAAQGNIGVPGCQYISPGTRLAGLAPSLAPASATRSKNNICPGISVNLTVVGGTLGTNAGWMWYTGSCGTSLVGTGSSISVTPSVTTTYYVRAEGDCNATSCASVTVNISCDIDKDKDGIPDWVESNMAAAFQDANSNGIINAYDPTYPGFVDNNNDYINDNFQADGDSDNDGILNYLDTTFPGRVDSNGDGVDDRFDTDRDGRINMLDLDSENDGVPDVVEVYGVDVNGNGQIDNFSDADGDGLTDQVDANAVNAYNSGTGLGRPDVDGDAVPNYVDLDSDNDGIPDVVESAGPDANNNGIIDGFVDANNDGLHDGYINGTALLTTGTDGNADGRADTWPNKNLDRDLRPNAYDLDADGDGIVDVIEAGLPDANLNGIVDGVIGTNGWSTTVSAMAALNLRNTDTNGNPDYLDIDSDDDGIPDNIEGMSTAGYLLPTTTDADGDGLMAPYDNLAGYGGSGIFVYDHDADGTPDYRDLDTDADGQLDVVEGNDFNLNGLADDLVTLTGLDTDNDGLDNRFDSLNSVTNVKGTSYLMGNGGSTVGDPAPGARCPVQSKTVGQTNRDWRFVGIVLPVQFLQLNGVLQSGIVKLKWVVIASKEVDHFEVERSTDNVNYIKTGTVSGVVKLNEQQDFTFNDDVSNVNREIIYYRIKVIGKAGEIQYSNILVMHKQLSHTLLSIMPNPARENVSLVFFSEKESEVTIRLINNLGKTVLLQHQKAAKGNNTPQLAGLSKYASGVYSIQVFVNDEVITQKLVLVK
ncbi:MAG TPA: T9SS type A sorting domain-containing protein [Ferruginibacter sp.]|nr:T9SS type A sorting domain-containing protein [Ferruginibacter sp.]